MNAHGRSCTAHSDQRKRTIPQACTGNEKRLFGLTNDKWIITEDKP